MVKLVKIVTHHKEHKRAADLFAEEGVAAVGWIWEGSIAGKTKEEIEEMLVNEGFDPPEFAARQLIAFRDEIKEHDIVIAYRTKNIVALIGEVTHEYEFNPKNKVGKPESEGGEIDYPNQVRVRWWERPRNFHRKLLPGDLSETVASRGAIRILDYDVDVDKLKEALNQISSAEAGRETILEVTGEDEISAYLKQHIRDLEEGLVFKEAEYGVSVGSIDILAEDKTGSPVVIEVKVKADDSAVGQVLGYMQAYREECGTKQVRGLIVAQEFSERSMKAAKQAGIKLYRCRKSFAFQAINFQS